MITGDGWYLNSAFAIILLVFSANSIHAADRPNHVVLGYVPYWRDSIAAPENFNFDAFTHLARAFLRPHPDGSLLVEPDYFNPAFEQAARSHGVKLLMSIGGESKTPDMWLSIGRDPQHVQKFLDTLAQLFDAHHYDGVDIDWEPPPQNAADGQTYAALLQSVRKRFPNAIITIAVEASNYGVGHLPMDEVLASIDYLNAMTYDFSGSWTGVATFGTNLHPDAHGIAHTRVSVDEEVKNLLDAHHVPPAKVLVGLRFWANRFRVDQLGDHFPKHGKGYADDLEYSRVMDLLGTGQYTSERDETADAPYLLRKGGGAVVAYDDPQSIRDKCKLVIDQNCAGVIIWHVGADLGTGDMPLLSAVDESFGMAKLPTSRPALAHEIARLTHEPVSPSLSMSELQQSDGILRTARGRADDMHWYASSQPTTQPTTQPATQLATTRPTSP